MLEHLDTVLAAIRQAMLAARNCPLRVSYLDRGAFLSTLFPSRL